MIHSLFYYLNTEKGGQNICMHSFLHFQELIGSFYICVCVLVHVVVQHTNDTITTATQSRSLWWKFFMYYKYMRDSWGWIYVYVHIYAKTRSTTTEKKVNRREPIFSSFFFFHKMQWRDNLRFFLTYVDVKVNEILFSFNSFLT